MAPQLSLYKRIFGVSPPASVASQDHNNNGCPVGHQAWQRLTQENFAEFRQSVQARLDAADNGALLKLEKLRQQFAQIVSCEPSTAATDGCHNGLKQTLHLCQILKQQLLQSEVELKAALAAPLETLFANLVCMCREQCVQYAQINPGANVAMELMQFTPLLQQTLRQQKAWLDHLCVDRQLQVANACDRLAGEVQETMTALERDGEDEEGMVDGSISDIMSTFDTMSVSQASGMTGGTRQSTTAPSQGECIAAGSMGVSSPRAPLPVEVGL